MFRKAASVHKSNEADQDLLESFTMTNAKFKLFCNFYQYAKPSSVNFVSLLAWPTFVKPL
ncbi:MAG: hypothetical protein R3A50_15590 [Saprospiraceae bacterium]|nr:hypothetical protein [Saprospiraceae bacterium]MCB9344258.1 hypothetical protein [Lewinellaceae bacterium]